MTPFNKGTKNREYNPKSKASYSKILSRMVGLNNLKINARDFKKNQALQMVSLFYLKI